MRLWTIHPKYLDAQGLVALWREALLARAVLRNETVGYRNHPQLERFKLHAAPRLAINIYLSVIHTEAAARGYRFDRNKIGPVRTVAPILATMGQIDFEWKHLLGKLSMRQPQLYEKWRSLDVIEPHPIFNLTPGPISEWERAVV